MEKKKIKSRSNDCMKVISITLVLFMALLGSNHTPQNKWFELPTPIEPTQLEVQLGDIDSIRTQLSTEVEKYILRYAPESKLDARVVVTECVNNCLDLKLVLAQGLVESAFGTKGLARATNSVWNVGAFDDWDSSKIYSVYKYESPTESIHNYIELLKSNYLGPDVTESDLLCSFVDKYGRRYASSENYECLLRYHYDRLIGSEIDRLQSELIMLECETYKLINHGTTI